VRQVIVDMTVKFAKENPSWGYDRISVALSNLGYHICDSTIGNILKAHGIEPAPTRKRSGSWETFLQAHWDVMALIDLGNELIVPMDRPPDIDAEIETTERLGGLLRSYRRAA
jgi:hypothetical protein